MHTKLACDSCALCHTEQVDLSECITCGLLCAACVGVCPHDLSDQEVLRRKERDLATAQAQLAEAETRIALGADGECYWQAQRSEAGQVVSDLVASITFRRRWMAQEQAA